MATNKKRGRGQPRKLDDKTRRKRLLDTLLRTGSRTKACKAAGISFQGFNEHIKRDDELREAVDEIQLRAIAEAEDCVEGSVATDPLMALRLLERLRPEKWSRQRQHFHKHGHIHLTVEQQQSSISAIAAELGISDVIEEAPAREAKGDPETDGISGRVEGAGGTRSDSDNTHSETGRVSEPEVP